MKNFLLSFLNMVKNIIPAVWIKLIKMDSTIELMEILDDKSFKFSQDPELLDVICYYREQNHYGAVGEYIVYLRNMLKDFPELFKLTEEYIRQSS